MAIYGRSGRLQQEQSLTLVAAGGILVAMNLRVAISVTLILLIGLFSFFPVPVGGGPFPSVYGPATAFRAYRAAQQLQAAVATIFLAVGSLAGILFLFSEFPVLRISDFFFSPRSAPSILRC